MRFSAAALLASLIPSLVTAAELRASCEVEAKQVVEHARKKGFRFETTRASGDGTCEADSSEPIFIASATSRSEVVCNVRVFFKKAASNTSPSPEAPATPTGWVISWVRIAGPNGSMVFADPSDESDGSWVFQIRAAQDQTAQYRLDRLEFTTDKDCTLWKDAFGS